MGWYERLISRRVPNLSPEEAYRLLQNDPRVLIVDVRQPVETRSGSVPGAVLIPLTEIGRRMEELPRDRPILTICRSSHRSPIAARRLKQAGYDVTNVLGGTIAWSAAGLPLTRDGDGTAGAG